MGGRRGEHGWRGLREIAATFRPRQSNEWLGLLVNLSVRLSIVALLAEVMRFPNDPRFAGKAIPIRNFLIVSGLSLVVPVLQVTRRPWPHYPYWLDSLYLSIFWLDMLGNSLDLYDSYVYFDLIPHAYGPGALAVVMREALDLSPLGAVGLTNIIHILLEAQEYYTDVVFGTHNVRGLSDTVNDLLAGVVGSSLAMIAAVLLRRRGAGRHGAPWERRQTARRWH